MKQWFWLTVLIAALASACAPAAQSSPTTAPTALPATPVPTTQPTAVPATAVPPTNPPAPDQPTAQAAQAEPTGALESKSMAYNGPAWTKVSLVNAVTGQTFTLADYAGKTVFVEPFATWCTNCARQLPNVETARQQLQGDQYVFVVLSVAENVDNAMLAKYAQDKQFGFVFAAAPEALAQGLVDSFGRSALTPPSTPHFVIKPDGSLTDLHTGSMSSDDIVAKLKAASGA
jgi:peroxiredoxin